MPQGSLQLGQLSTWLCAGSGSRATMSEPSRETGGWYRIPGLPWAGWSREPHTPTWPRTNRHQHIRPLAGAIDRSRSPSGNALLADLTLEDARFRSGWSPGVYLGTCAIRSIIRFVHGLSQLASARANSRYPCISMGNRRIPRCSRLHSAASFQQTRPDGEMSECASFEHADDASGVHDLGCRPRHYIFGRSLGIITARTRGPL